MSILKKGQAGSWRSKIIFTTVLSLLLSTSVSGMGMASASPVSVVMDGIKYPITKATPFEEQGITWIPLRFVSENLGAKVSWNGATKAVGIVKGEKNINLTVGSSTAMVNGNAVTLGSRVMQKYGTTMVPLRFVSEELAAEVEWDAAMNTVVIRTPGKTLPKLDRFGRAIRTTHLPKTYQRYPYILADIPNEMYDMKTIEKFVPVKNYAEDEYTQNVDTIKHWKINTDQYYNMILNVDYRTIDDKWAEQLNTHVNNWNRFYINDMKKYVRWVKENKIIIEGNLETEPSLIKYNFGYYIGASFKFRIVSYKQYKSIFFDDSFDSFTQYRMKFKKGQWYVGYANISLGNNVDTLFQKVGTDTTLFTVKNIFRELRM